MTPALPTPLPCDPALHSVDRGGASIVSILAHDTNTPRLNGSSLSSLQTGDGRGVSIHRLINRDGSYYQLVPDTRGANHAGSETAVLRLNGREWRAGAINRVTLSFELERSRNGPFYPDAQLRTCALTVLAWRQAWGPLPIVRHATIDPTRRSDPRGLSVEAMEAWVARVAEEDAPPAVARAWIVLQQNTWVRARPRTDSDHIATLTKGVRVHGKEVSGGTHRGSAIWVELEHGAGYVWRPQLAPVA